MEIWYRFPKFVLGFIGASILFSVIYEIMGSDVGYALIDHGVIRGDRGVFRGGDQHEEQFGLRAPEALRRRLRVLEILGRETPESSTRDVTG